MRSGNDALLVNRSRADAATEVGKEVTFGSVKGLREGKVVEGSEGMGRRCKMYVQKGRRGHLPFERAICQLLKQFQPIPFK